MSMTCPRLYINGFGFAEGRVAVSGRDVLAAIRSIEGPLPSGLRRLAKILPYLESPRPRDPWDWYGPGWVEPPGWAKGMERISPLMVRSSYFDHASISPEELKLLSKLSGVYSFSTLLHLEDRRPGDEPGHRRTWYRFERDAVDSRERALLLDTRRLQGRQGSRTRPSMYDLRGREVPGISTLLPEPGRMLLGVARAQIESAPKDLGNAHLHSARVSTAFDHLLGARDSRPGAISPLADMLRRNPSALAFVSGRTLSSNADRSSRLVKELIVELNAIDLADPEVGFPMLPAAVAHVIASGAYNRDPEALAALRDAFRFDVGYMHDRYGGDNYYARGIRSARYDAPEFSARADAHVAAAALLVTFPAGSPQRQTMKKTFGFWSSSFDDDFRASHIHDEMYKLRRFEDLVKSVPGAPERAREVLGRRPLAAGRADRPGEDEVLIGVTAAACAPYLDEHRPGALARIRGRHSHYQAFADDVQTLLEETREEVERHEALRGGTRAPSTVDPGMAARIRESMEALGRRSDVPRTMLLDPARVADRDAFDPDDEPRVEPPRFSVADQAAGMRVTPRDVDAGDRAFLPGSPFADRDGYVSRDDAAVRPPGLLDPARGAAADDVTFRLEPATSAREHTEAEPLIAEHHLGGSVFQPETGYRTAVLGGSEVAFVEGYYAEPGGPPTHAQVRVGDPSNPPRIVAWSDLSDLA